MRVVFFGSPDCAVPFLKTLVATQEVIGVVTRPDRPSGRGHALHQTAVSAEAHAHRLTLQKPVHMQDAGFLRWLESVKPDCGVVVAFGKIFPEIVLNIPRSGFINIHFSLLPQYRGPAPIQHALINGDTVTGITSFYLLKDIDAGPVLVREKVPIKPEDDYVSLEKKLVEIGQGVLKKTLPMVSAGQPGTSQEGLPGYAPLIKKDMGRICWDSPVRRIAATIKALVSWPCAYTALPNGKILKITASETDENVLVRPPGQQKRPVCGTVTGLVKDKGFIVQCSDNYLLITRVIPEGKREMSAYGFIQGRQLKIGDILGPM